MRYLLLIIFCFVYAVSFAQDQGSLSPEDVGFHEIKVGLEGGSISMFISSGGTLVDTTRVKPLIVYLQGSGYGPIVYGPSDRPSHTLLFRPSDFPNHHYVVISKPGAPFWSEEIGSSSQEYNEQLSLEWRVNTASKVIDYLVSKSWIDHSEVIVVGHSEGAQVAPAVAATNNNVTHIVALAASALSQAYDFVIDIRHRVIQGELSFEEGQEQIESLYDQFHRIQANPQSVDSLWIGHTYLRWSSFFKPPLMSFLQLEIPIFVGVGALDNASPIESADYLPIIFIQEEKENLTYRVWPADHGFRGVNSDGTNINYRPEVLSEIHKWILQN